MYLGYTYVCVHGNERFARMSAKLETKLVEFMDDMGFLDHFLGSATSR
jgi:hypothetical protein